MKPDYIAPQDLKYVSVNPSPDFDPVHNMAVIEKTIKDNELLVSNKCVNASLFNVTLKVIGLTNIQPIIFYRTCGKFQEWRQLIKTTKVLKSAEFDRKQLNTNITIIGSDALLVKKIRTSKIAERIDMGYLKMTDTTQQVARVFLSILIINICNPLTYLFVVIPTLIIIFRKRLIKFIKKIIIIFRKR